MLSLHPCLCSSLCVAWALAAGFVELLCGSLKLASIEGQLRLPLGSDVDGICARCGLDCLTGCC